MNKEEMQETLDRTVAKLEVDAGHSSRPAWLHQYYSTEWEFGGPIIEREKMKLWYDHKLGWTAQTLLDKGQGATPLIAAMRCYVASKQREAV